MIVMIVKGGLVMVISNGYVSFKWLVWLGDLIMVNNGLVMVYYYDILVVDWDVEWSDNLGIFGLMIGSCYDVMVVCY